jgi:hypothetical protein
LKPGRPARGGERFEKLELATVVENAMALAGYQLQSDQLEGRAAAFPGGPGER